jgi:hypothetical protein
LFNFQIISPGGGGFRGGVHLSGQAAAPHAARPLYAQAPGFPDNAGEQQEPLTYGGRPRAGDSAGDVGGTGHAFCGEGFELADDDDDLDQCVSPVSPQPSWKISAHGVLYILTLRHTAKYSTNVMSLKEPSIHCIITHSAHSSALGLERGAVF